MKMEPQSSDNVKFEKEKAVARFNRFRKIARLWQVLEALVVFGLISWSSTLFPAVLKATAKVVFEFSAYIFNHHIVFLIGNSIILLLFFFCRHGDAAVSLSVDGDFYENYVKRSEAVHPGENPLFPPPDAAAECGNDEEKHIVACSEDMTETPRCDDVAAAIENATRQIEKFRRTQSEKLKREITIRPRAELRRSEMENFGREIYEETTAEIENLSSEEFRRTVDAFIDKHWIRRKQRQFEEFQNYQLVKSS